MTLGAGVCEQCFGDGYLDHDDVGGDGAWTCLRCSGTGADMTRLAISVARAEMNERAAQAIANAVQACVAAADKDWVAASCHSAHADEQARLAMVAGVYLRWLERGRCAPP